MQKKAIGTVYALCFFFLCAGLFFASGMQQINGSRMNSLFVKHAVPFVQERFTPDEMRSIAEGLCAFLRNGDRSSLLIGTQSDPVFSAREMLHLADADRR